MRIFTNLNMKTAMAAVAADSAICHVARFKSIESIVRSLWDNVPSLQHNESVEVLSLSLRFWQSLRGGQYLKIK